MKIISIIFLFSLINYSENRILKVKKNAIKEEKSMRDLLLEISPSKSKKQFKKSKKIIKKSKQKQSRKATVVKYTIYSLETKFNGNLNQINESYEAFNKKHKNNFNSENEIKNITQKLRSSNDLLMIYINTFILTQNVLNKYDEYMTAHHLQSSGDEQEIIKFLINNLKGVKLRKNEKKFFQTVKDYAHMVENNQHHFLQLSHSHAIKKNLQAKLVNSIRLTNFINKYIFYVEHLKNDFHYLDYDEEAETPNHQIDEDHYRMKHKNFEKTPEIPDNIPITIVFGNEDQKNPENEEDNYIDDKMKELDSVNINNSEVHQVDLVEKNFDKEIIDENKTDALTVDGTKQNLDLPDPEQIHNTDTKGNLDFVPAKKDAFEPENPDQDIEDQNKLVETILHKSEPSEIDKLNTFKIENEDKTKLKDSINLDQVYGEPQEQEIDQHLPTMGPEEIQNYINEKLKLNPNSVDPSNVQHFTEENNPDNIEIIHTPTVLKIDQNPKTIVKYDYGYGKDLRTRISERTDFQDSKNNDEYKNLYHAFRTVSQLPYQQLKEQVQDSGVPVDRRASQLKDISEQNPPSFNTPMNLKNSQSNEQQVPFKDDFNQRDLQVLQLKNRGFNPGMNPMRRQINNLQFNPNNFRNKMQMQQPIPNMQFNNVSSQNYNNSQNFQNNNLNMNTQRPNLSFRNNAQEPKSTFDQFKNKILTSGENEMPGKIMGHVDVHDKFDRNLKIDSNNSIQSNRDLLNQNENRSNNLLSQNNMIASNNLNLKNNMMVPNNNFNLQNNMMAPNNNFNLQNNIMTPNNNFNLQNNMMQNKFNLQNNMMRSNNINQANEISNYDQIKQFTSENPGVRLIHNRMSDLVNLPKERSLFEGNKKNHWEKKADNVFRNLLSGKL